MGNTYDELLLAVTSECTNILWKIKNPSSAQQVSLSSILFQSIPLIDFGSSFFPTLFTFNAMSYRRVTHTRLDTYLFGVLHALHHLSPGFLVLSSGYAYKETLEDL